jgi:hypothetical protein
MVIETGTTTYEGCDTQPLSAASTTPATGGTGQPTGTVKPDGLSGYTNGEYNFSLRFSPSIQPTNFFSTFHILASNWRINAAQANQGKAIVSFPIFRIDQGDVATGKSYPLFYDTEVRVGVSPNVAKCYEADAGYANQKVTNVVINGVTFKKFSSSDAAMMKYIQAESYRTIHNNNCYVLEQVRTGSSYKDDTMKPGLSQATLDSYYNMGETIIKTFKFTK